MRMWIFAAAFALSSAALSQTSATPVPGTTNTGSGINTEPGYVPPPSPTIRPPSSAAGVTSTSTPGTLGTSPLGSGIDINTMGSDLARLFDPTLPPGVGTGIAAPGGRENPSIPGR